MESVEFEFLSVIIATILYISIDLLWYSPLFFKKQWLKYAKIDSRDIKMNFKMFIYSFFIALVLCSILSLLINFLAVNTAFDGLFVGFGVWLGFVTTTKLSSVLWTRSSFRLYLIEQGCFLVKFCVIGSFLGA